MNRAKTRERRAQKRAYQKAGHRGITLYGSKKYGFLNYHCGICWMDFMEKEGVAATVVLYRDGKFHMMHYIHPGRKYRYANYRRALKLMGMCW